ncbi:MAG: hypothetical protein KGZ96_03250 [Clostridia bacterium]|nr:hypothetical protein [Clostridia bacterium]
MLHPLKDRIINELNSLSHDQQKKLLDYVLTLKLSKKKVISGKDLVEFSGVISKEDLAVMKKVIEENCEQVDLNEW